MKNEAILIAQGKTTERKVEKTQLVNLWIEIESK